MTSEAERSEAARSGTGPAGGAAHGSRHALPRIPLLNRLQMPAGKMLALAAMPTALLMGAGLTPRLALADESSPKPSDSCATASGTPAQHLAPARGRAPKGAGARGHEPGRSRSGVSRGGPSASPALPLPSVTLPPVALPAVTPPTVPGTGGSDSGGSATPAPAASATGSAASSPTPDPGSGTSGAGLVDGVVDGLGGVLTGAQTAASAGTASTSPDTSSGTAPGSSGGTAPQSSPTPRPSPTGGRPPSDVAPDPGRTAATTRDRVARAVREARPAAASGTPTRHAASPSPGRVGRQDLCATDVSGVSAQGDVAPGTMPDVPWTLRSSRLALHGAVFQGIVDVRTTAGTKRVLKFTVDSIGIGDLDMSAVEASGRTLHVTGAPGSTSTMARGPITMYTEKLSGHLVELMGAPVPDAGEITLTPDTLPAFLYDLIGTAPVPLDMTMTDVTAVQAGQFGGTLAIPGMHLYSD